MSTLAIWPRAAAGLALAVLLALAFTLPSPAATPDSDDGASGIVPLEQDGKRIYTVAQFARFAPLTAADVVQQIPGFSVTNVSNDRGIGEATQNVLINGQRITGKGNDAMTVLRRIPASSVQRLEIVEGVSLDITGLAGDVLNVVAEQDLMKGNFVWRPQIRERIEDHWTAGEVNISGSGGIGDYSLGFRWDGFRGGGWGTETEVRPASGVTVLRDVDPLFANDAPELSGTFNRILGSGAIWNLNASVRRERFRRDSRTVYQEPAEPVTTELSTGGNRRWRTEIGTDYDFALGGGRLKLVGLVTHRDGPNSNEFVSQQGTDAPTGSRFGRDSTEGERVLRSEYRWRGGNADWTLSAEGAQNFVDATGELAVLDTNGEFQRVALPGGSSRVEERRGQSILSFSRPIGANLQLQINGGGEYSVLSQDGDGGQTRRFWRPKGLVSLAWNPESPWEMHLKLQRRVGQLNFFDFLASVDVNNNNNDAGNPELVPPQSWVTTYEAIRTMGAYGKVSLKLEAEHIEDIVDQVPISATLEATGNLPKARRHQVWLEGGLLLDGVGLRGGKLDFLASVRDTRVRDPLTGRHRELNGNRSYWNVDFRHDVPGTQWTWGLFLERQSTNHSYRLDSEEHSANGYPFGNAFLEHKDVLGLKVRVSVANLFRKHEGNRQVNYVARRDGPIEYIRDYRLEFGHIWRLQVSGTF